MSKVYHLVLEKVKDNHSDALEKQPVTKKFVALLEKIMCLNIKARNLRAQRMPEISLCIESMVEHPETFDLKADHVANDVPFSADASYIIFAFDMANSVSGRSNHVLIGTSHMSTILVTTDLFQGHATEFSEAKKMGKSADNHVYEVVDTSINLCGSSARTLHLISEDMNGRNTLLFTLCQSLQRIIMKINNLLGTAHSRCMRELLMIC